MPLPPDSDWNSLYMGTARRLWDIAVIAAVSRRRNGDVAAKKDDAADEVAPSTVSRGDAYIAFALLLGVACDFGQQIGLQEDEIDDAFQRAGMTESLTEACGNCRFWDPVFLSPFGDKAEEGECLRHAPHPIPCPAEGEPIFKRYSHPLTWAATWCGEWAEKKK